MRRFKCSKSRILIVVLLSYCYTVGADNCDSTATTFGMKQCAEQATQNAKVKMNYYYSEAIRMVEGDRLVLEELKSSQNLWGEYAKAQCGAEWEMHRDASIRGLIWEECMASMTLQRTYRIWNGYFRGVSEGDHLLPDPR